MSSVGLADPVQNSIVKETSYYRMDKLVWEMRQAKSGLEMKDQKLFFSTVPSACTGKELVNWLRIKLLTPTETEALHLANALCRLGFIVPVNEKQQAVKLNNSCYRIQRPALWPSRKWDSSSQEYAIYLLKKLEKRKALENYEQAALAKLEQVHSTTWSILKANAKDFVVKYNRGSKEDREIEDSQDRCFWRVQRPAPTLKLTLRNECFSKNSVCMEVVNQTRKKEILEKKIKFMNVYLDKAKHHSEHTGEKTITILMGHCINYEKHDPLITKHDTTNPWIAIDEYFYEDLIDMEDKKHTKLDLESWKLGFRELITDSYGKELFGAFLQQEYSLENLYFWDACEDLKQSPQSKILAKTERIKRDFLQTSSRFEVNLDRFILQHTLEQLKAPTRYSMDKAQHHIYDLMKNDCYPRFLKSDLYRRLLLEFSDKRSGKDKPLFAKKMSPQRRDRKLSMTSATKILSKRHKSPSRPQSQQEGRHLSPHSSVSPYYMRRSSNATDSFNRSPCLDTGFAIRKAGSLSSLIASNSANTGTNTGTNRKKKTAPVNAVKAAMFDDEVDKISNDSGTYSGIYSTATYSPKSKSTNKKMSLKKKHSFSN